MKKIIALICLSVFVSAYTLKVDINNLRDSKGEVIVSLYNKDGSIPDKKLNKYYKQENIKIHNKRAIAIFNIPKGRYAVGIVHDENNNHKVDMGFMLPKEGVGFSNFTSFSPFNRPNFKKASFEVDKNLTIKIQTLYF